MYRACIFDLDGTLANTLSSIAFFANAALRRCGYATIPTDRYRYLVGNGADSLMRGMLAEVASSYTERDVEALREAYDFLYESDCTHLVREYPGMAELVASLRLLGERLAVLSNKPHNVTTEVVQALFPPRTFDLCYGQREGIRRKPAPDGALMIAHELGVKPADCLYIGDTDVDMRTGAAAGMDTAGATWGFRGREELRQAGATFLAETPDDILRLVASGMR